MGDWQHFGDPRPRVACQSCHGESRCEKIPLPRSSPFRYTASVSVPIAIAFTQLCRVDPLSSLLLLKNNICISSHPKCAAHSLHTHPGQLHGVLHIEGLTDLMAEMCVSKLSKRDPLLLLAGGTVGLPPSDIRLRGFGLSCCCSADACACWHLKRS